MNLEQFAGLKPNGRFDYGHREYYGMLVEKIGYDAVAACIPFSEEECRKALEKDLAMNSTPIGVWDRAGGFLTENGECVYIDSPLTRLLRAHGITVVSNAECVCLLKECARMRTERACNGQYYVQKRWPDGSVIQELMPAARIVECESMSDCSGVEMRIWEMSSFGVMTQLTLHGTWHDPDRPLYIKAVRPDGSVAFDGYGIDH